MKLLLRVIAAACGLAWGWFCWRALVGPESVADRDWRTAAFIAAFLFASVGWPGRPSKPGTRRKERL